VESVRRFKRGTDPITIGSDAIDE